MAGILTGVINMHTLRVKAGRKSADIRKPPC